MKRSGTFARHTILVGLGFPLVLMGCFELPGVVVLDDDSVEDGDDEPIDSDGDGLSDETETALGTSPDNADTDGDGLDDGNELDLGTDPTEEDTDGDGYTDGEEHFGNYDPTDANDKPYIGGYGRDDCWADYIGHPLGDLSYIDQHGEAVYFRDFCAREIFIESGAYW